MGIGKRIGDECRNQGLTIRQLAIKAEIPYSTLYSAIKRDSDGMDAETIKKIADALDVPPAWFLRPLEKKRIFYGAEDEIDGWAVQLSDPTEIPEPYNTQMKKAFECLNAEGRRVAVERVQELSQLPKYQRQGEGTENAQGVPEGTARKEPE